MRNNQIWSKTILIAILMYGVVSCANTKTEEVQPPVTPAAKETLALTSTVALLPTPYPSSLTVPILLGEYTILSPDEMRSDLDQLFTNLESTHPNLYVNRPKAEVDHERQQIYSGLVHAMTNVEFFRVVAPLVASLGDYHTEVFLPNNVMAQVADSEIFFPLGVEFAGQRAFITENHSGNTEIALGSELVEINGITISDIQSQPTYQGLLTYPFWSTLWFLYGSIPEYQVKILSPGEISPVMFNVAGMKSDALRKKAEEANPYGSLPPLSYDLFASEEVGILTISNFEDIIPLLKPAFTQIQEDKIEHLIIDIRSNAGGKYDQIDLLMRYLTDQPYQQCARRYFAPPDGNISTGPQDADCSIKEPTNTPLRFNGKMYLLLGPDTFSAAITFATILQDYGLAVLIGEETRDTASYCAFVGDPQILSMNLFYRCSERCFIRPSGVFDENGVIPDIIVETTIRDKLDGVDPVFDFTLDMIQSGVSP